MIAPSASFPSLHLPEEAGNHEIVKDFKDFMHNSGDIELQKSITTVVACRGQPRTAKEKVTAAGKG